MLVVLTQAHLKSILSIPRFMSLAGPCVSSAKTLQGNLGSRAYLRSPYIWCTVTAWTDMDSMLAFVRSEPHAAAMKAWDLVDAQRSTFLRVPDARSYEEFTNAVANKLVDDHVAQRDAAAGAMAGATAGG